MLRALCVLFQILLFSPPPPLSSHDDDLDCSSEPFNPYLFHYWFDGVLVAALAFVGVAGNLLAMKVLRRPRLRDVFHQVECWRFLNACIFIWTLFFLSSCSLWRSSTSFTSPAAE